MYSTLFCTFLCCCFACETSRNFLVTCFVEEMLYVVLFTFFSLPLILTLVAASVSHFLTAAIKFSCYSYNEIGLLFFISVIHSNVDFKIKSKERIGFVVVVFYLSKSPGGYAVYCQNTPVLEMQNFTPAYMKGWMYVQTYSVQTIFSEPKFPRCIVYQIFLPIRCSAAHT